MLKCAIFRGTGCTGINNLWNNNIYYEKNLTTLTQTCLNQHTKWILHSLQNNTDWPPGQIDQPKTTFIPVDATFFFLCLERNPKHFSLFLGQHSWGQRRQRNRLPTWLVLLCSVGQAELLFPRQRQPPGINSAHPSLVWPLFSSCTLSFPPPTRHSTPSPPGYGMLSQICSKVCLWNLDASVELWCPCGERSWRFDHGRAGGIGHGRRKMIVLLLLLLALLLYADTYLLIIRIDLHVLVFACPYPAMKFPFFVLFWVVNEVFLSFLFLYCTTVCTVPGS